MVIKAPLSIRDYGRSIYINNDKKIKNKRIPLNEMLIVPSSMKDRFTNDGKIVGTLNNIKFTVYTAAVPDDDSYLPYKYNVLKIKSFKNLYEKVKFEKKPYLHLTANEASFIYAEEFFKGLEREHNISIHSFDIETNSDGIVFPSAEKDPIIAIGFYDGANFAGKYTKSKETMFEEEEKILKFFFDYIRTKKPDILVGYNSNSFDLQYIIKRSYIHHMDKEVDDFVFYWHNNDGYQYRTRSGMIIYDLWNSVMRDQSLSGKLADRKLETVGEYFGFETIRAESHNFQALIGTQELKDYHKNDVVLTWQLAQNYIPILVAEAELLHIPLENIITAYPSFIPRMFTGRALLPQSIIPLYSNMQKYGIDSRVLRYFENKKDKIWAKYEAAIVRAQRTGFYKNISKIDFSSYYPTTAMTLGIGPDNTKILKTVKYDGKTEAKVVNNKLYLKIPDKNINRDVIIVSDKSKPSYYVHLIKKLYNSRKEIKKRIKETNGEFEKLALNTQQNAIKVVMNSIYGINGLKSEKMGDMSVAVAIVGYCRDITSFVLDNLIPDTVLETDTDGFYVAEDSDIELYNKKIEEYVKSKYFVDTVYTKLDKEHYDAIYIMKKKNYILKDGDKFISHGSSIVNSANPNVYNKALQILLDIMFNNAPVDNIINMYTHLDEYPVSDFIGRMSVKPLEMYKSKSSRAYILSKDYMKRTKTAHIIPGTKAYFIVESINGTETYTTLIEEDLLNDHLLNSKHIAYNYYRKKLETYMKMFNIDTDILTKGKRLL